MIFVLTKKITNPFMKLPIVKSCEFEAQSFRHAIDKLTVSNEHTLRIKRTGETSWIDSKNSTITLSLKEKQE